MNIKVLRLFKLNQAKYEGGEYFEKINYSVSGNDSSFGNIKYLFYD